ncbi:unnamed protein product [Schistosoma mattheei]|uniref:Leishmanolysin-like peptidase n=1 Tax=Schistosoma mattheei TaxID=31246 RepID=A0AA85BYT0_9TREM|nr:unnamed protein product [Schistosoma mattheei]
MNNIHIYMYVLFQSDSIYSQNIVKRSSNRLNLKIIPVYDRKVETSKVFSKIKACHARKYGETEEIFTEGEGIAPNEFVLLVSWNYVACGASVLAWASYCSHDPDTSRPNLGIVNYCLMEDAILGANEKKLEDVTKHEICHALDDLMTPSTLATQSVSRIILAYFKDTNFYDVDYTMATEFNWGKGLGCDFVMKSCYEFIKNRKRRGQDIQPFCDKPNEMKCLRSQNAQAYCTLYKREGEINPEFQYMDNSFNVSVYERKYYGVWTDMTIAQYLM